MTVYMSEEEQVEMLKSWWKKYGNIVTVIISLILLSIAGFRYWNWHKTSIEQQASAIYERMMVAYANNDYKQIKSNSQRLIDDFKSTIYADVAHLTIAKVAVNREKYQKAQKSLSLVIANSKSPIIVSIARVRMARLYLNEKKYAEANVEINKVTDKSLQSIVSEIEGDIALAQNKRKDAIQHYKQAMLEVEKIGGANVFLEMKSNSLFAGGIETA